jgi:VCBS repeat-containing protein
MVSGNNQTAAVGTAVANPLVVRVTDANSNPVAGVSVNWTAEDGGSVAAATSGTDASGLAQMTRTLGTTIGQYRTIAAVDGLAGSPITFTSTATVGAPVRLAITVQPGEPTVSGEVFNPVPRVQLQDAFGNPVALGGITVVASIAPGSGEPGASLTNEERNTNSSGLAIFNNLRITGPPAEDYVLVFTGSVAGVPLASATSDPLTVTAGGATRLVVVQQPSGTVQNGAVFPQQPVIQVVDGTGNPVVGSRTIEVELGVGAGNTTLGGTLTASTGSGSTATFTDLRITGTAGAKTLLFSSGALTPAESQTITVTAGPAASVEIVTGDDQTAGVGQAVPIDPAVRVEDASGNPVAGVSVQFAPGASGGAVAPTSVTTGANGVATVESWTLGGTAGPYTLTATVSGAGSVTFNAEATAVNSAPSAQADAYSVDEDGTLTVDAAGGVLQNDNDPDSDDLTAQLESNPTSALTFTLSADGSFTYTPLPDFNGTDSFTYHANDGQANSNNVTVTITVNPVNDAPTVSVGPGVSTSSLASSILGESHSGWATGISPGPNESSQTVELQVTLDDPADAAAFQTPPQIDDITGTLTYTPELRFETIVVDLTVVARDSEGATSSPQTFSITINP